VGSHRVCKRIENYFGAILTGVPRRTAPTCSKFILTTPLFLQMNPCVGRKLGACYKEWI